MEAALFIFCLVLGLGTFGALLMVIYILLKQVQALENKLMSRDFSEYSMQSRTKSSKPGSQNFIRDNIERANRQNGDDE